MPEQNGLNLMDFEFDLKALDETGEGSFTGYAAVYGNVDLYNEVLERGAFKDSLVEKGYRVPLLWMHDIKCPIGFADLEEDGHGLRVKHGQILLAVPEGQKAYELMKAKIVDKMSVGFRTQNDRWETKGEKTVRYISKGDLWEVSPCVFSVNPLATVGAVKSITELGFTTKAIDALADTQKALGELLTASTHTEESQAELKGVLSNLEELRKSLEV